MNNLFYNPRKLRWAEHLARMEEDRSDLAFVT